MLNNIIECASILEDVYPSFIDIEVDDVFEKQVRTCVEYISARIYMSGGVNKTFCTDESSYAFKHYAETFGQSIGLETYISNNAFIVAALMFRDKGLRVKFLSQRARNAYFNFKKCRNFDFVTVAAFRSSLEIEHIDSIESIGAPSSYLKGRPANLGDKFDHQVGVLHFYFWRSLLNCRNSNRGFIPRKRMRGQSYHPLFLEYAAAILPNLKHTMDESVYARLEMCLGLPELESNGLSVWADFKQHNDLFR
ncbi:hypothetical protein [Vibrio parahaemolyticus]|uniref:hypothetical protein n=1 Tax=Vibrio parahaemolyticus TaxID=670 RepID=UPI0004DF0395|nr:hypothetical protein [Vibrio parahaemolyticus]